MSDNLLLTEEQIQDIALKIFEIQSQKQEETQQDKQVDDSINQPALTQPITAESLINNQKTYTAEEVAALLNGGQQVSQPQQPSTNQQPLVNQQPANDIDNLVNAIFTKINSENEQSKNTVFATLWNEKLQSEYNNNNGFKEFLESEDDYGKPRIERLNQITDYNAKVEQLAKLTNTYRQALGNNNHIPTVVDNKRKKIINESDQSKQELLEKFENQELSTLDYIHKYLETVDKEYSQI